MIICSKFTHIFRKKICELWQVGRMTSGSNFFPKIVKVMGIIPKFHVFFFFFFWKKIIEICCSQKTSPNTLYLVIGTVSDEFLMAQ